MTELNATINSLDDFTKAIKRDYAKWRTKALPWFRGEPKSGEPLLPSIYRKQKDRSPYEENILVQNFRRQACAFSNAVPERGATDEWLFLMQHFRLPTRLLDWTESLLIALYFALLEDEPIVWMLDPCGLNQITVDQYQQNAKERVTVKTNEFWLTWFKPQSGINPAFENIGGAWTNDSSGVSLPVAIRPTHIHIRMSAQRSCFTVHGIEKKCLCELIDFNKYPNVLKKYEINPESKREMSKELRILGISEVTIFPDLEGLAKELKQY